MMNRHDPEQLPDSTAATGDDPRVNYWSPSGVVTAMWISLSILLGSFTFFILGLAYSLLAVPGEPEGPGLEWWMIALLTAVVLLVHQIIHAAVARLLGGTPTFELDVIQWILPAAYVRVDGQVFSQKQFLVFALAPMLVPILLVLSMMPGDERTIWMIIPLSINSALSVRDIWQAWVAWFQPKGSFIQVERNGLRMIHPS